MRSTLGRGLRAHSLRGVVLCCALFVSTIPAHAQSDSLVLASGSANPGGSISLNLSLASGTTPTAAVQWTLTYNPASITGLSLSAGATATAASKSLSCSGTSGSYTCLVEGLNQNAINDGTVAVINATVSSAASGTVTIVVTNVIAAGPDASNLAATGSNGNIVVTLPTSLSSIACNPTTVNAGGTSSCTVTMAQAVSGGGAQVSLSSNNAAVSIPGSVTVATGAATATFTAALGSIASNQTAVVTATYNGVSQGATLSLAAQATVSSVSCAPASLNTGASTTCTATLSMAAPSGGAVVSLSSNNGLLTVPASVTVPGAATTATFTGTAGTITSNQSAVVTAAYNNASQTATVALIPPATVSLVACTPTVLSSAGNSSCTVTLSQVAPNAGAVVALSSSVGALTVPASVTVASGAQTAIFTASTSTVSGNQSATITAAYNNSSQTTTLSLVGVPVVDSISCAPAGIGSGAATNCIVSLSGAAPSGGAVVTLASNNALLAVPGSVAVPPGAISTAFTATGGTIPASQTATISASFNGGAQTATVSLFGPGNLSSLSCTPASLSSGGSTSCTITLSQAAPQGGAVISLVSSTGLLSVPQSVTVAAGSPSGTFFATAGTITNNQTATVIATYGGNSQSASISLTASGNPTLTNLLSSLSCTPGSLGAGETATCTLMLSGPAPNGGAVVTTTSSTLQVTVQPSVTVTAGAGSAIFFATATSVITAAQPAVITATLHGATQSTSIGLSTSQGAISSLTCSPDPTAGGTLNCLVQLTSAVPITGNMTLQAASGGVQLPSQVAVPTGAQSVQFRATVLASDQDQQISITAAMNGASSTLAYAIAGIRPTSLVCPSSIQAGSAATCVVHLTSTNVPAVAHLRVATTSANLKVPVSITTRPRQTRLTFLVQSDPLAPQQGPTVSVQFGSTTVSTTLIVQQATAPLLTMPPDQAVMAGNPVNMTISAADPGGLAVTLSTGNLPAGASFDPGTGIFSWTPTTAQQGTYNIPFTATNTASASSSGQITIHVDSGNPIVTDVHNAASQGQPACSPGSVASVVGRWLASTTQAISDLTGGSTALGGAQVLVNGAAVPVLAASFGRIDFLCPVLQAGTVLNVSVQNSAGSSDPAQTAMQNASVGVFSNDGSGKGQGVVFLAGTSLLATSRSYQGLGQPAQLGDAIAIRVTGLGTAGAVLPMVKIGDLYARADAINAVAGMAGVYDVTVTVPPGVPEDPAVPVAIVSPLSSSGGTCSPGVLTPGSWPSAPTGACSSAVHAGDGILSNVVSVAVEMEN